MSSADAIKAFVRLGYNVRDGRGKGSHTVLIKPGGGILTVPHRSTLKRGTLAGLISQSDATRAEFLVALRG